MCAAGLWNGRFTFQHAAAQRHRPCAKRHRQQAVTQMQPVYFQNLPASGNAAVRTALDSCKPGYALPRYFYTDADLFGYDMRHFVLAHWHCVGHVSMAPNPGGLFHG